MKRLKPLKQKSRDNPDEKLRGKMESLIPDLSLLLIYLTGWEEDKRNAPGKKVFRAWKGYKYEILNELQNLGLIYQIPGGRSLLVTDTGKQRAVELMKKYLGGVS